MTVLKKVQAFLKHYFRNIDKWLLLFCCAISVLGVLIQYTLVHSDQAGLLAISNRVVLVQAAASAAGILGAVFLSNFDYHVLAKLWKLYIPASLFLVLLTFFIGMQRDESIDDKAWLPLPFGMTFQPSELLKICFILSFAYHLSKVKNELNRPLNVLLLCLHGGFPVLLVHFQGDDGTAIVFACIFVVMIFAAGLDWKYIAAGAAALMAFIPIAWQYLLSDDQRQRFLSVYLSEYADPLKADYQQRLGRISIGLGGTFGKGLFQEDYWYVPEMQNDFVFSFIGQALGFVGTMIVVVLLSGICFRAVANARMAPDPLGTYICYGFFGMFFSQCLINIGMCISVLPVVGITLPFLSSGGSSIAITYLGVGLVLSVSLHRETNLLFSK